MARDRRRYQYRSLFWPILLIGVGAILLLENLKLIPDVNLTVLFRLWPLLLVVIGLDLLVGRRSPVLGALIGLGLAVVIAILVIRAPELGLTETPDIHTSHFAEPIGSATSARISLALSVGTTTIEALSDSPNLITADLTHVGQVAFNAEGESEKSIDLRQVDTQVRFDLFDITNTFGDLTWKIGLTPRLPLVLDITGGVGKAEIDLSGLQLSDLKVDGGVGEVSLTLPATGERYLANIKGDVGAVSLAIEDGADITANVNGGVGNFGITAGDEANLSLQIQGGVGNFTIDVPGEAAVRIGAEIDVGNLSVPAHFSQVSGSARQGPGESGVWETANFESAGRRIIIEFNGDIGNLKIR